MHISALKSQHIPSVCQKKNMLVSHDQGTAISMNVRRYTGRAMAAKENIGSKKRSKRFLNGRGLCNSVDFRFLWFSHLSHLSSSNCFEPRNMDFQVVSRCLGSHFELRKCEWVTSSPSCPECLVPFLPMKFSPRAKLSQNEPGPRFRTSVYKCGHFVWSYVGFCKTNSWSWPIFGTEQKNVDLWVPGDPRRYAKFCRNGEALGSPSNACWMSFGKRLELHRQKNDLIYS